MVCLHCPTLIPILRQIKVCCTELCGSVHTAQSWTATQITFGFSTHFISLGVGQCECTIRKVKPKIDTISFLA